MKGLNRENKEMKGLKEQRNGGVKSTYKGSTRVHKGRTKECRGLNLENKGMKGLKELCCTERF